MLNKCANPACRESFRRLEGGKPFRLESQAVGSSRAPGEPEYFWLCPHCAGAMSLRLDEHEKVKTVPVVDLVPHTCESVNFVLLDRKPGSFLSCLHFVAKAPRLQPRYNPRRRMAYAS